MAKIRITRSSEWMNRARAIGVYIDGQKAGTISNGETKEFDIPAGDHVLRTKIDWCGSKDYPVSVSENEIQNVTLSSFGYSYNYIPIISAVILLHFFLLFVLKINYFVWLLVPIFLVMVYYLSFGRNGYLVIRKSNTTFQ